MNRFLALGLLLIVAAPHSTAQQPDLLPAPAPISPLNSARLHPSPSGRNMVFEWAPVKRAIGYAIQIECFHCCKHGQWCSEAGKPSFIQSLKETKLPFTFYGDQPGAWRVWAMDKNRRLGQASPWQVFTFGPDNDPIPSPPLPAPPPATVPDFSRPVIPARGGLTAQKLPTPPVFDPITGEACSWPRNDFGPGATPPKAVYAPDPLYPQSALAQKASGDVKLAVDVGEDGMPKRVCILNAPRADFGKQAVATVRTWKFQPGTRNGVPIPFAITVEVTFRSY